MKAQQLIENQIQQIYTERNLTFKYLDFLNGKIDNVKMYFSPGTSDYNAYHDVYQQKIKDQMELLALSEKQLTQLNSQLVELTKAESSNNDLQQRIIQLEQKIDQLIQAQQQGPAT